MSPPLAKADIAFIFVYNCVSVSVSQRETVFFKEEEEEEEEEDGYSF